MANNSSDHRDRLVAECVFITNEMWVPTCIVGVVIFIANFLVIFSVVSYSIYYKRHGLELQNEGRAANFYLLSLSGANLVIGAIQIIKTVRSSDDEQLYSFCINVSTHRNSYKRL
jgi:hypothetical protein